MKQVVATCIYKDNMIYNLVVQYKERSVTLVYYDDECDPKPYRYNNFDDMYNAVLSILRQNGYYTKEFQAFGKLFYNVNFINLNRPNSISRHGLPENY